MNKVPRKKKETVKKKSSVILPQEEPVVFEALETGVSVETFETIESVEEVEISVKNKNKFFTSTKILAIALVIVSLIGLFLFVRSKRLGGNSAEANEKKVKEVVEKVEKIIDLPQGELPSLAIVDDVDMLRDQPFFADAKKGDMVLLYGKAQKVYIYNPDDNMIINASSLNFNENK
ncbi:MAG: hypothetical protein QG585_6 [Patescibacteria group bacterium]|jgi:hypothetical protein|nr:hypothetical protein [Patescibacteria group bacterium]